VTYIICAAWRAVWETSLTTIPIFEKKIMMNLVNSFTMNILHNLMHEKDDIHPEPECQDSGDSLSSEEEEETVGDIDDSDEEEGVLGAEGPTAEMQIEGDFE
jgi:hypothetical protein